MKQKIFDDRSIVISLPNEIGFERIAMQCSASYAKTVGFLEHKIEDLKTAVSEACLNAMEHGNKGDPDTRVIVTLNYQDSILSISVVDKGEGIDELPEDPDIEEKIANLQPPRGLGIFLIRHLVDEVEFNKKTEEGHMVRMLLKMRG